MGLLANLIGVGSGGIISIVTVVCNFWHSFKDNKETGFESDVKTVVFNSTRKCVAKRSLYVYGTADSSASATIYGGAFLRDLMEDKPVTKSPVGREGNISGAYLFLTVANSDIFNILHT